MRHKHTSLLLPLAVVLASACVDHSRDDAGNEQYDGSGIDGGVRDAPGFDVRRYDVPDVNFDGPIFEDAACGATFMRFDEQPGMHLDADASIVWTTNPPSSGDHFGDWARWGIHNEIVPRGNWVHNLEHGGVVVLYRCDGDCTATRNALVAFVQSIEPEAACIGTGVPRRIVLTQDPLLDVPVAAASWGWTYRANCVDTDSLGAFVRRRTGHAPEDFCTEGTYP